MITILTFRSVLRVTVTVAMASMVLNGCGTTAPADGGTGVTVVSTTSMWGDVARQIVGGDGTVEVLMPLGSDPHDYQPSAGQAADLHRADLVIANGLGLEEGLQDVLAAAVADGVNVYEVAPDLNPIPFGEAAGGPGDLDPHAWFDPERVALAARNIADRLAEIDPDVEWQSRADAYAAEMGALDQRITALVASIPADSRKLVTNHDALGYFAGRYGFDVVGVVIPGGSTLSEPSSAELAALVSTIELEQVPAIFAETTNTEVLAEAVAAETGHEVKVVELYTGSLGPPGSDAETLAKMLLTDAQRIVDALS